VAEDVNGDGRLTIGDLMDGPVPLVNSKPNKEDGAGGWSVQIEWEGDVESVISVEVTADGTQKESLSHFEIQFPNADPEKSLDVLPARRFRKRSS
jgi:hypothetical protein